MVFCFGGRGGLFCSIMNVGRNLFTTAMTFLAAFPESALADVL